MNQYKDLVSDILSNGVESDDRTGTGTLSVFGRHLRFDLQEGFPLVTVKKTWWKGVLVELLWIMQGQSNIRLLQNHKVKIWDQWADENGDLGPVYGTQLRSFGGVDQLANVIHDIRFSPSSRRIVFSLWNPVDIPNMALPPCHGLVVQFYVSQGKLSCFVYQRSVDTFLGLPFNIASYACMLHLIANDCDLEVGDLVYSLGDTHIYKNHLEQCRELLNRSPFELPTLDVNIGCGLLDFLEVSKEMTWKQIKEHVILSNYHSHAAIKGDVSI